jgi:hypothetical protein
MSGPPAPHPNPAFGSNSIGHFTIGVSPVGTIPPFDWWATVISQYANAPILTQLIQNFNAYVDQTKNFDDFLDLVWSIDTAQGWGLDVWGRILNVSRILLVPGGDFLGFTESGTAETFGFGTFFSGADLTSNFALADAPYRTLLFAKALSNIWDGSTPAINQLLLNLFPNRGNCYVIEGGDFQGKFFGFAEAPGAFGFNQAPFYSGGPKPLMHITYVFEFMLSPVELAIVQQSGAIPRPTGVSTGVEQI